MNHQVEGAPHWELIGKKGQWKCLKIRSDSDGNVDHWPNWPYRPSSEERYLIQLGKALAQKDGLNQTDVEYFINKLPRGYALFEIDQPNGNQIYKRLFGHPLGRYYDSIIKFQVHFLWLMSGMQGACECVHCGNYKAPKPVKPIEPKYRLSAQAVPNREKRAILPSVESDASTRSHSTSGRASGPAASRPQRQIKAVGALYAVDAEGTEDVYKDHLKRLEAARGARKGIEADIWEVNSFDWRAEHAWDGQGTDLIQQSLTTIERQHSFIPRVGELVLFCPTFLDGHYLMLDEETQEYKFYSFEQRCFHGFPAWRGGLITTAPAANASEGPVDFPDIQDLPDKRNSLNTGGFRVETFPDPNNEDDKKASKQYRYVPMRNIRPFSHWQLLMRGIPRDKWHPSIEFALTCMTSVSLLEKWWFTGEWPNASIWCQGIYIGAELIITGDTIRIAPQEHHSSSTAQKCTDVMVIDSIRLNLLDIKPEHTLPDSPVLSSASSISLVGRAYTLDVRRHYQLQGIDKDTTQITVPAPVPSEEVKTVFRPVGSAMYGPWYRLHDERHKYEISYDQVLGRMHEAAAVQLWTGKLQSKISRGEVPDTKPILEFDMKAIQEGRRYSSMADERLAQPEGDKFLWFWADTRAEALDVETINGFEVGKFDSLRDKDTLDVWRTHVKVLNGQSFNTDNKLFQSQYISDFSKILYAGKPRGRKAGSKVVDGRVIMPGDLGYEEAAGNDLPEPRSTPRHGNSQLAVAALVSTDEEDDVFEDAVEDWGSAGAGTPGHGVIQRPNAPPKQKQQKHPRTKAQIMGSADHYLSDDEDEWIYEPIPPARGGTEESEGGDYDPDSESDGQGKRPPVY